MREADSSIMYYNPTHTARVVKGFDSLDVIYRVEKLQESRYSSYTLVATTRHAVQAMAKADGI